MPTANSFEWDHDAVLLLKTLWNEDLSCAAIAARFGVSRNAIIGKVHRLHLPSRERDERYAHGMGGNFKRKRISAVPETRDPRVADADNSGGKVIQRIRRKANQEAKRQRLPDGALEPEIIPDASPDDLAIPQSQRRTFAQLKPHHCKWPVGNPGDPDFFFCGAIRVEAKPYCETHCRVAFRKPVEAKRDDDERQQPALSAAA